LAAADSALWDIDVDRYSLENLCRLDGCAGAIRDALRDGDRRASATLVTKVMLGVFGSVPAFDQYFERGTGIRWGRGALRRVAELYDKNRVVINGLHIPTRDFATGGLTSRPYPKAKLIDMVGFVQGQRHSRRRGDASGAVDTP
jgi:hypothetical protein